MNVQLTNDQRAFIQQAIANGRYSREEEVLADALSLWEERERTRAELLAAVDAAEASLTGNAGRVITDDSMEALAQDVKLRGRARLASR